MSGLFYVFVKWAHPTNHDVSAKNGRYMLCLSSRYEADELFRALKDLKDNGAPRFTTLTRTSAQFWCHHTADGWGILNFQVKNDLPRFKNSLSTILMSNAGVETNWPIIPNPVQGPDWISGGEFFIRNRRQPNLYWYIWDNHIHTSESRRTKFSIKISGTSDSEPVPMVMIRADKVSVRAILDTVSTDALTPNNAVYVSIAKSGRSYLEMSVEYKEWGFGELVNKAIGVRWDYVKGFPTYEAPLLTYMPTGGGDEWELV